MKAQSCQGSEERAGHFPTAAAYRLCEVQSPKTNISSSKNDGLEGDFPFEMVPFQGTCFDAGE